MMRPLTKRLAGLSTAKKFRDEAGGTAVRGIVSFMFDAATKKAVPKSTYNSERRSNFEFQRQNGKRFDAAGCCLAREFVESI
ncbi:MAG: hypothetical protein Rhob2KO_17670 [Rhodopirellula baltica]